MDMARIQARVDVYDREFEQAAKAHAETVSPWRVAATDGVASVQRVSVEGSFPASQLHVVVVDDRRPDLAFGERQNLWSGVEHDRWSDDGPPRPFSASYAGRVGAQQAIEFLQTGLPSDGRSEQITWVRPASRVIDTDRFETLLPPSFWSCSSDGGGFDAGAAQHVALAEVRLRGRHPDTCLQLFLRDDRVADCLVGAETRIWTDDGRPHEEEFWPTPQQQAWILWINLEEWVATTWAEHREPLLAQAPESIRGLPTPVLWCSPFGWDG